MLQQLQSKELVLAFSGPLGSGVSDVKEVLREWLEELGYKVAELKISSLIKAYSKYLPEPPEPDKLSRLTGADRYEQLQDLGNRLRGERGNDFLALLSVTHIQLDRQQRHPEQGPGEIIPDRIVYLVDQLKHPEECELLRAVYGDNFYLVGVLCSNEARRRNLLREGIAPADAERIMENDRKQDEKHGQKLEKTLQLADFFVRNSKSNTEELKRSTNRFLDLIHGSVRITPSRLEQGMYAAYSAGLSSACLSRQVGAAIHDAAGNLIATGCNDVPRGGGGLYTHGDGDDDHRCVNLRGGICFNHLEKEDIRTEIEKLISVSLQGLLKDVAKDDQDLIVISRNMAQKLARSVREGSRLKDLIEFSRSVHAEMDALVGLARSGSGSAQDGILFTTTYPCHNCARHIVAAGLRAVYFIEPYEKSLAQKLHSDAIAHDQDAEVPLQEWQDLNRRRHRKVSFLHFEGVAPRRYLDLFEAGGERKDPRTGKVKPWVKLSAKKKVPQFLEGYPELEARITQKLTDNGIEVQKVSVV
jgi:deoxycytidylate deaminase